MEERERAMLEAASSILAFRSIIEVMSDDCKMTLSVKSLRQL